VKADWKGASVWLQEQQASRETPPTKPVAVIVHPSDPRFPREELEAARYYLGDRFQVETDGNSIAINDQSIVFDAICHSQPAPNVTPTANAQAFVGLSVTKRAGK
jgi:hypothetical protein